MTSTAKTSTSTEDVTDFDPTTVPVFPVLTVEIIDGRELLVDGRTETVPDGLNPTDAAVASAAEAVRRRGLDHCRVSAVLDGTAYPLVVGADGSRYDLSASTRRTRSRQGKRGAGGDRKAWVMPVAVMVFVIVGALVAVSTIYQFRGDPQPLAAAVPTAPAPTELPVLPPDGWSTHASWSVPLASLNRTAVLADGNVVLAVTHDRTLSALDPRTGSALSEIGLDGAVRAGPVPTTIDAQPVTAVATSRYLYWWSDPRNLGQVQRLPLDSRATVSFAGTNPLIVLPGQHAAAVVNGAVSDRTIPAGAQAVRADGNIVTALDGAGRLWRLDRIQPHVPEPVATLQPSVAGARATVLGSIGAGLVIAWRGADGAANGSLSLVDLDGRNLARRSVSAFQSIGDWVTGPDSAVAAGHVFTLKPAQIVPIVDSSWRSTRILESTIYGTTSTGTATLDAQTGKTRRQTDADAAAPVATDREHAYAAADTPTGPTLYALQPR